jgi:GntR family carbon starvation induced transcriptional regulator
MTCRIAKGMQIRSVAKASRYRHVILADAQELDGFLERHEALMRVRVVRPLLA